MMSATWSASPAAGRCMSGEPFVLDGRVGKVEERFPSDAGLQADALLIRFDECAPGQIGVLGTTVKSLEQSIAQGKVHFLESAAALNVRHGWEGDVVCTTASCRSGRYSRPGAEALAPQTKPARRLSTSQPIGCPDSGSHPTKFRRKSIGLGIDTDRCARTAAPHAAALSIISSRAWTSVRQVHDHLSANWRSDWGARPSYRTVHRWVEASRIHALARPSVRDLDERRSYK